MRKAILIVSILLAIVLGLRFYVEFNNKPVETRSIISLSTTTTQDLKITFLDIGQGDAAFIQFPANKKMLVDCSVDNRILSALGRTLPFYDQEIDYLLITHPDLDHYGGCIEVLKRFKVNNIIYNGLKKPGDKFWDWFWQEVQQTNTNYLEINKQQSLIINSTTLNFFYPDAPLSDLLGKPWSVKGDNNTSLVFGLNYQGHQVLFTGDMMMDLEKHLLDTSQEKLKSDILKVGHHGSSGSSLQEFLDVVKPAYAIISVGKDNKFGHPTQRVLKKLERVGAKILRTDEGGDVECIIDNKIVCNGLK
jgi:competence protein ComEC